MLLNRSLLLLLCLLSTLAAVAQNANIPIGEWRSHFPNGKAISVTQAGSRIYCSTEGGFFYYDVEDNSLHPLAKEEGFSDVGVQQVAHDPLSNITLVAYRNTNIDLILPNGRIYNIRDILNKPMIGAKRIQSIYFHNRLAYLSTTFGVVVLDLERREIRDTYANLGPNGRVLEILSTTILNDSLYISAKDNNSFLVMRGRLSGTNLLDFNNWTTFQPSSGLPSNEPAQVLGTLGNKVFAGVRNRAVYYFNGSSWNTTAIDNAAGGFYSMKTFNGKLYTATEYNILEFSSPGEVVFIDNELIERPLDMHRSNNGDLWIADYVNGLLRVRPSGTDTFVPNGPYSIISFDMLAADGKVYVSAGRYDKGAAYTQSGERSGFYVFENGEWKNYNPIQITDRQQYPDIQDVVELEYDPRTKSLFLGAYGHGVVRWKGPGNFQIYDETNSPLINIIPGAPYTRISGLAMDRSGTLWVVNFNLGDNGNRPSLFALRQDGTWNSFSFPNFRESGFLEKIAIDDSNQKWIIVAFNRGGGILVFNDQTNQYKHLTEQTGKLPSPTVNSITKDLSGAMWVGTANGIAVYYNPSQVMQPTFNTDPRPIIDGRYLLENQVVNDIAVDGGNRKWVAAETGLWLFNESGTELLAHFTAENSPLPSNKVNKVTVNHATGEVFAATDAGLVSYRSTATITEVDDKCKGVFPNPVRQGFTGTVGITGVPSNAMVKITDLSGTLVYETRANGNMATWDLRDYNGKRARSGIYLIMSASNDGTEKFMCKIAVLE